MKKHFFLCLLIAVLMPALSYGQVPFVKKYPFLTGNIIDMERTSDGGYILLENFTGRLTKTNATGDTLWTCMIPIDGDSEGRDVYSLIQTGDGYLVEHVDYYPGCMLYYIYSKISAAGTFLWSSTSFSSGRIAKINSAYLINATSAMVNGTSTNVLRKLSNSGAVIWQVAYPGINGCFQEVIRTPDGGFLASGSKNVNGIWKSFLLKTNSAGAQTMYREYFFGISTILASARKTTDGGYIFTGSRSTGLYQPTAALIAKTNALGDTLWTRILGQDQFALQVEQVAGGGYALLNRTLWGEVILMRLDAGGNLLWQRMFYGSVSSFALTPDGGFVLTQNNNELIKTDGNGLLCSTGMNGIYSINRSLPASEINFTSFSAAAQALHTRGVCGPVTITVRQSNTPYQEQAEFLDIPGADSLRPVRIIGSGYGYQQSTQIQFAATSTSRHVLKINGADWLTLDGLGIKATGSTYGWGVYITGASEHCTIKNCVVTVPGASASTTAAAGVVVSASAASPVTAGSNIPYLKLELNTITGGAYGISVLGPGGTAANTPGLRITGNQLNGACVAGIYLRYLEAPFVRANYLSLRTSSPSVNGLMLLDIKGRLDVQNISILNPGLHGIYAVRCQAPAGQAGVIANTVIAGTFQNTGITHGIYLAGNQRLNVYHNSVRSSGTGAGRALTLAGSGNSFIDVRNNSLAYQGTGSGYALWVDAPAALTKLDYNNYFSSSAATLAKYGAQYPASLQTLRAAAGGPAGHDLHSDQGNPGYKSATDLEPITAQLNNKALSGLSPFYYMWLPNVTAPHWSRFRWDDATNTMLPRTDIGAIEYYWNGSWRAAATESQVSAPAITGLSLQAFPNPFSSALNLLISAEQAGPARVELTDLTGRLLWQEERFLIAGTQTLPLDLASSLPAGLYLVGLTQGETRAQFRIVKQ